MTKPIFSCINLTVLLLLHFCESNVEQVCPAVLCVKHSSFLFLLLVVVVVLLRLLQVVILYANNNKNGENMTIFCVFQRASATKSPLTSLVVVENVDGVEAGSDEQEQSSVPDSEGHLEVVQPSDVWQTLKPGNAVFMCRTLFDKVRSTG